MFVFTAFQILSIWKVTIGRVFEWNSRCNFAKHDQILSEQKVPHLIRNLLSILLSTVFIFHNRPCRSLGERNSTEVGAKYNPLNFPNVSSAYPEIDYLELRIVSISIETISLRKASALWNFCCSSNIVDILCISGYMHKYSMVTIFSWDYKCELRQLTQHVMHVFILLSLKLLVNDDRIFIFSELDLTIMKGNYRNVGASFFDVSCVLP